MKSSAVIVAAGMGRRMGAGKNKVFLELSGMTVLERTVSVFNECSLIDEIIVVTNALEECEYLLSKYNKVKKITLGGDTRQKSVENGLLLCTGELAVIHDGARALITCDLIEKSITAAEKYGACAVGVKCKDTLKLADKNGFIQKTVDREFIYNIQTPQVFKLSQIKKMHAQAKGASFTDDCALAESFGMRIKIAEGSYDNIKITTPDDLQIAEKILESRRRTL